MARTARIELRAEPEREEQIRAAARITNQSISSFVLDAATERARDVLATASTTVVPSNFFDEIYRSLDHPPEPNPALQRAARRPWRVQQK
jgi:uncharacterized protein (DUF1778 family)